MRSRKYFSNSCLRNWGFILELENKPFATVTAKLGVFEAKHQSMISRIHSHAKFYRMKSRNILWNCIKACCLCPSREVMEYFSFKSNGLQQYHKAKFSVCKFTIMIRLNLSLPTGPNLMISSKVFSSFLVFGYWFAKFCRLLSSFPCLISNLNRLVSEVKKRC